MAWAKLDMTPPKQADAAASRAFFRSDGIGTEKAPDFDLTRFLEANRSPLRWKTL
jgi:hypothetical protein